VNPRRGGSPANRRCAQAAGAAGEGARTGDAGAIRQGGRIMKKMKFYMAMLDYFGYRPNEGLKEFRAELQALSEKDRTAFKAMLKDVGYEITE
jgi:hypothetical protein